MKSEAKNIFQQVLRVLVGNKIDRDDHEIPLEVGEEFANRFLINMLISQMIKMTSESMMM